jgi:hypothetical protein
VRFKACTNLILIGKFGRLPLKDATTLIMMTFSIMTLNYTGLVWTLSINDIEHNNALHNNAECRNAECRTLFIVRLSVIMQTCSHAECRGTPQSIASIG